MQINDFLDKSEFRKIKKFLNKKGNVTSLEEFLFQPPFEEANKVLTREMGMTAGYELLTKLNEVFGEKRKVINWFYSESLALGNQRPYDYCKSNNRQIIFDELVRIEYGVCC